MTAAQERPPLSAARESSPLPAARESSPLPATRESPPASRARPTSGGRTLVAGVGNIFLSDDGFGPEVARQLRGQALPPGVHVEDYGIRGTHLAYDLLAGWDGLVLIDTVPPRSAAGSLHVLEVHAGDVDGVAFDPHGMDPNSMLAGVTSLGGTLPPTVIVGCEPAVLDDGIGLSAAVADAVPRAIRTVLGLLGPSGEPDDASRRGRSPGPGRGADEEGGPQCVSASPVG